MAIIVCTGFETQIITAGLGAAVTRLWSTVTGTPTISTAAGTFRSGARGAAFAAAATVPSLKHDFAASQTYAYFRAYFRLTDATPTSDIVLANFDQAAGNDARLWLTTGGVLQVSFATSSGLVTGPTLSNDTWYGVEMQVDIHANPNLIQWRTWDSGTGLWTNQTTSSFGQAASTFATTSGISFGIHSGPTSGTTVYFDDVLIGSSTTGADYSATQSKGGKILRYRPTSDGTHSFTTNDFGYNAAGSTFASTVTDVWGYVDDDDQTSTSDGILIRQAVARSTAYCELVTAQESTENAPRCVAITAMLNASSTGANQTGVRVHDGTSATTLWNDVDVSDTATQHFKHYVLAAAPSGAWTRALVNSTRIRFGYATSDVSAVPYYNSFSKEVEWQDPVVLFPSPAATLAKSSAVTSSILTIASAAIAATLLVPAPASAGPVAPATTLTPDAVAVTTTAAVPTVALTFTATPDAAGTITLVPDPTVVRTLGLTPDPAPAVTGAPAPTIGLAYALAPDAAPAITAVPAPTIVQEGGPVTVSPDPVPAVTTASAVTSSTLILGPAPPPAVTAVPVPTVEVAQPATTLTPDAIAAITAAPSGTVELYASPDAVAAVTAVPVPTVTWGHVLTPDAIAAVTANTVSLLDVGGIVTVQPDAVAAVTDAPAPTIVLGALTVQPDPAAAITAVPAPTLALVKALAPDAPAAITAIAVPAVGTPDLFLVPDPAGAVSAVPTPTIVHGALALIPDAVAAVTSIPEPDVASPSLRVLHPDAVAARTVVPHQHGSSGSFTDPLIYLAMTIDELAVQEYAPDELMAEAHNADEVT